MVTIDLILRSGICSGCDICVSLCPCEALHMRLDTSRGVFLPVLIRQNAKSLHEAVKGSDCLTIITDHREFKNLNLKQVKALMNEKPAIIDAGRIINHH